MHIFDLNHERYQQYPVLVEVYNEPRLRRYSDRTMDNYLCGIIRFLDFTGKDDPDSLDINDFRDYLFYLIDERELAPRSVNANNFYIRFLYEAVLDKHVNHSRVHLMKIDKPIISFLNNNEVISLLAESRDDPKIDLAFKLGLCAGLRISEVLSLKVRHLDLDYRLIRVVDSKGYKSRIVPMDITLIKAINRYLDQKPLNAGDFLVHFRSSSHKGSSHALRYHFNICRDRAGLSDDICFHSLRHTFATNFILNGGDVMVLSALMGHRNINTTYNYLKLAECMKFKTRSFMDKLLEE